MKLVCQEYGKVGYDSTSSWLGLVRVRHKIQLAQVRGWLATCLADKLHGFSDRISFFSMSPFYSQKTA